MKAALTIDTDQLEAFAADAKERKGGHRPWDKHDPKALPKHNVSVRLNDYHLEMPGYLAEDMDMSQQKILRKARTEEWQVLARFLAQTRGLESLRLRRTDLGEKGERSDGISSPAASPAAWVGWAIRESMQKSTIRSVG
jgi:hypothetical protein